MKFLIFNFFALILYFAVSADAQPVSATDAIALINELPAPPTSLTQAYQRAYTTDATSPDAAQFYNRWLEQMKEASLENQQYQMQFYQKNPMGVQPAAPTTSKASPQQQASMNAATAELAQKMLNDPAFAQKFTQMNEQEQRAYIAGLLADKGLKPASGTPNVRSKPMPGMDVGWAELCTAYMQTAVDMSRWETQISLQQQYENKHQEVRAWEEESIKNLPMHTYGEYGRDHDPEQVKAIRKQALGKHRDLAAAMLKEMSPVFAALRQETIQRITPLNDALKAVHYGQDYDFGIHYPTVIGTYSMMILEAQSLLDNEINLINDLARREYEWLHFK